MIRQRPNAGVRHTCPRSGEPIICGTCKGTTVHLREELLRSGGYAVCETHRARMMPAPLEPWTAPEDFTNGDSFSDAQLGPS